MKMVRELLRTHLFHRTTTKCFSQSEGRIGVTGEEVPFSSELLMQSRRCVVTLSLMDRCSITVKNYFVTLSLPHALSVTTLYYYGNTLLREEQLLGSPSGATAMTLSSTSLYVAQCHIFLLFSCLTAQKPEPLFHSHLHFHSNSWSQSYLTLVLIQKLGWKNKWGPVYCLPPSTCKWCIRIYVNILEYLVWILY